MSLPFTVAVRYGLMMNTERFQTDVENLRVGDEVILRTTRGIEFGTAAGRPVPAPSAAVSAPPAPAPPPVEAPPPEAADGTSDASESDVPKPDTGGGTGAPGEVLRRVRPDDRSVIRHIRDTREPEAFKIGRERIREHQLDMRLVGVEYLFGGEKVVFYFIADGRVDFRALVKDLARRFRTRIEMRQIGVRDEARLLADHEHCGRELCCRTFIRNLEPVTMRMAKTQKTTLDPTKISGHCGRLMCCLRFEDSTYTRLQAEMPQRGAVAVTARCTGEVIGGDILKQEVLLLLSDGTRESVRRDEITELRPRPRPPGAPGGPGPGQGQGPGQKPGGDFQSRREGRPRPPSERSDTSRRAPSRGRGGDEGRRGPSAPQPKAPTPAQPTPPVDADAGRTDPV